MDPFPGQGQLFSVEATAPNGLLPGTLPRYEDVVLTAAQIEEAKELWPSRVVYKRGPDGKKLRGERGKFIVDHTIETTPAEQIRNMKCRVLNKMRYEIEADSVTGRRAFGGPQLNTAGKAKKRADESLVEAADNRIDELIDAAFSSVSPDNSNEVRHKSAMNIIKVAQDLKKIQMTEEELDKASGEQLENLAAEILAQAVRDGKLTTADFNLTEADVVELGP
jgi:hypothetical protein